MRVSLNVSGRRIGGQSPTAKKAVALQSSVFPVQWNFKPLYFHRSRPLECSRFRPSFARRQGRVSPSRPRFDESVFEADGDTGDTVVKNTTVLWWLRTPLYKRPYKSPLRRLALLITREMQQVIDDVERPTVDQVKSVTSSRERERISRRSHGPVSQAHARQALGKPRINTESIPLRRDREMNE